MSLKRMWNSIRKHLHPRKPQSDDQSQSLLSPTDPEKTPPSPPSPRAFQLLSETAERHPDILDKTDRAFGLPPGSTRETLAKTIADRANQMAPKVPISHRRRSSQQSNAPSDLFIQTPPAQRRQSSQPTSFCQSLHTKSAEVYPTNQFVR